MIPELAVDDRVWFEDEQFPYTVQAVSTDGRWVALTKPFAARHTVLYTVLDRQTELRGKDNYGGLGYETREQCEHAIGMFEDGEAEHSHRHPPIPVEVSHIRKGSLPQSA